MYLPFFNPYAVRNALCGLLFLTVLAHAQGTNRNDPNAGIGGSRGAHTIRGKIFLPSGNMPEVRLRVILEATSGGIVADTFSDSVGNFEFRSVVSNNYRVVVQSDGFTFETAQEPVEATGSVARTFVLQIYLREKNSDRTMSRDKTISAAEFMQDVPKSAKKNYEQGLKRMNDGKPEEAAALFQEALKIFPDYVLAHNKLGQYYLARQQFTEAQTEFEKAIATNPKLSLSHINLGILMVNLKRYNEAIEHLEAANKLDESFPMTHLYLGIAWLEKAPQTQSDLDQAERALQKAIALGGKDLATAHKYIFNIHLRRRHYDKAAAELEAYLTDAPHAPDAAQIKDMLVKVKKAATTQTLAPKP